MMNSTTSKPICFTRGMSHACAAALLVAGLVACRDPGPPAESGTPADAPAEVVSAPEPVAAPSASLEIDAFEGARLELNGKLRARTETQGPDGVRHVVRIEHFYASTQDALAEIELQMQEAGYHVTLAEDGTGARVFSPDGQKGSVEIIDRAFRGDLVMGDPEARGLVSFFWVAPPKNP